MTFMKNHMGTLILHLAVALVFIMGAAAPGFAARIDEGVSAKAASTMTPQAVSEAPQTKTETAPPSTALGQETILRKAEDKAHTRTFDQKDCR
jgi:hypothetical protein